MNQKKWLEQQKDKLSLLLGESLSWDQFAEECSVDPRALKSYRMPDASSNYRVMSDAVIKLIEKVLENFELKAKLNLAPATPINTRRDQEEIAVKGLAAMVQQICESVLIEKRPLTAISERPGSQTGLTEEQRRIMSMVSRIQLELGMADTASQIHLLLDACKKPLGKWFSCEAVVFNKWDNVVLLDPSSLLPTSDCIGLASSFSNVSAEFEDRLFKRFVELLGIYPKEDEYRYYSKIRSFVIKNPICEVGSFFALSSDVPLDLISFVRSGFYEEIPKGFVDGSGQIEPCAHCGSLLSQTAAGTFCSLRACRISLTTASRGKVKAKSNLRVQKSIETFWVEPGFDEVRLYDQLVQMGFPKVEIFPFRDRTDISVNDDIGIDLKSYVNPEILGRVLASDLKGLNRYRIKIICIPDWHLSTSPDYIKRLKKASGLNHVDFLSVSEVPGFIQAQLVKSGGEA